MAVVEDVLRTRLEAVGISGYARQVEQAARALGVLKRDLGDAEKAELGMGIAAGAASLALIVGLERAAVAAGEHQAILQRTALSFQDMGHAVPQGALEEFGNRLQDTTAIARDQAIAIAGLYGEYGQGEKQAEALTKATLNAAEALKARGLSATTVAARIGIALERAKEGDPAAFSRLSQIGIIVDKAKAAVDPFGAVMDALTRKGGNQAEMFRQTLPGALDAFQNSLTRLGQDMGRYIVPPLTKTLELLTGIVDTIDKMPGGPALAAGAAGAAAIGFAVNSVSRLLPFVVGSARLAGGAARGVAAVGAGSAMAQQLVAANPGLSLAEAEVMAAQLGGTAAAAGAARGGAGALGFLRGPGLIGTAAAAGGLALSGMGAKAPPTSFMGNLEFIGGRALTGAGIGAAVTGGNPVAIAVAGIAGAIEGAYEKMSQKDTPQTQAVQELVQSNRDLKASMDRVYKSLDSYIGNSDVRDVLGDSRLVAAFARGIA